MFSPTSSLAALSLGSPINNNLRPFTTPSSNLKRKRSPLSHPDDDSSTSSTSRSPSVPPPSASSPSEPLRTNQVTPGPLEPVADSGLIRCICGFTDDDGLTIFCDMCGFWQHISCVLYQPQSPTGTAWPEEDPSQMDTDVVSPPNATTEHSPRAGSPSHPPIYPSHLSQSPSSSRSVGADIPEPKFSSKPKLKSPSLSGQPKLSSQPSSTPKPAIPETLPEQWFCERCSPRPVDAAGARERQMARMLADRAASVSAASVSAGAATDEAEMDEMVDIDDAGPSTPVPPVPGKRRAGSGGEKRRKSSAADNTTATSSWGAPPPPRRASTKAGTSSSQAPGKSKRLQPNSGLSKRDEDTLFEPWATEYTHISADVVPDRRVREQIAHWAQRLLDEEEDWCHTTPMLSSGGKVPTSISPLTSCIPVHPFSAVFASSVPGVPGSSGSPNAKKVKVQVRPVPNADCTPLPSPSVCPASPLVTPTSYPFPPTSCSPLPSPGPFDLLSKSPISATPGYANSSAGYTRPPTYGLYTACPTAHSQQQSLASSSSSGPNSNTGGSSAALPYFTSTVPAGTFLAPFTSNICSLESYVTAPSSQYSLLQTAKPFVHLIGRKSSDESREDEDEPPALALDAREMGGEARWARSGCFPNAVIRPVLGFASPTSPASPESPPLNLKKGVKLKPKRGGQAELTLSWGLYSTRPIAPRGEEIILGWEWDRCSAVHRLKKIVKDGCSNAQDESDMKTQLSQILYTLGGTFTSCACGRQNNSSFGAGDPVRECVFSVMVRFVCERSRFIGKPSAGLTLSVPVVFPPRSINGSLKRGSRTPIVTTPVMTSKLALDAVDFDRYRTNIDLGPMVGWPDEEDEQLGKATFPLGAGPGVCALPLPNLQNGTRRSFLQPCTPTSPVPSARASTPPPTRTTDMDTSPRSQSHSAPPHFANTNSLLARAAASTHSPIIQSQELKLQPVRRGWADVVGLNDSLNAPFLHARAPSPSPHSVPPSVRSGKTFMAPTYVGKVSLPKLQTCRAVAPDLQVQVAHQTLSIRDSSSLSSSLGLDVDSDDVTTEMDLDTSFETASITTADSSFGLAEEPKGQDSVSITNADGQPVKLPPWARKRVRSTSSASPIFATPPPATVISGTSCSLPAMSRIHEDIASPVSEPMIEDMEMENGTVAEEPSPVGPSDTKVLPAELIVDPSVMPPPPIPAALDPTTVTSISVPSTPVIEQPELCFLTSTPASAPDRLSSPTADHLDAGSDVSLMVQDAGSDVSESGGNEDNVREEQTSSQPPPVRMSFLDWKRKRETTQKERVLEHTATANAEDQADPLCRESEAPEKPSQGNFTAPSGPAVVRCPSPAIIELGDAPITTPPGTSDAPVEVSREEQGNDSLSEAGSPLPAAQSRTPFAAPMLLGVEVGSTNLPPRFPPPEPTSVSAGLGLTMEIDDDVKAPITYESEASTKVSPTSSTSHPVSEEDAEDGEIVDPPVEYSMAAAEIVNRPAPRIVEESGGSRGSTPASSLSRPSPPPRRPPSPDRRRLSLPARDHQRYGSMPNGKMGRRPAFPGSRSFAPASPVDPRALPVSDRDCEDHRYRGPTSSVNGRPPMYSGGSPVYGTYPRPESSMPPFSSGNERWYSQRRASPPPLGPRDRDYEYRNHDWNNRGRYQRPYRGRGNYSGYRPHPNNGLRRGNNHGGGEGFKQRSFDPRPHPRNSEIYLPAGTPAGPPALEPGDIL